MSTTLRSALAQLARIRSTTLKGDDLRLLIFEFAAAAGWHVTNEVHDTPGSKTQATAGTLLLGRSSNAAPYVVCIYDEDEAEDAMEIRDLVTKRQSEYAARGRFPVALFFGPDFVQIFRRQEIYYQDLSQDAVASIINSMHRPASGDEPLPLTTIEPDSVSMNDFSAQQAREEIWTTALLDLKRHSRAIREGKRSGVWHQALSTVVSEEIEVYEAFPSLPAFCDLISNRDEIHLSPLNDKEDEYNDGYRFREDSEDENKEKWRFTDEMIISFYRGADGEKETYRRMARIFLYHEYVHQHHSLTKYTARGVGRFANCLERIDYQADLYALLHELDWELRFGTVPDYSGRTVGNEYEHLKYLLDLLLVSMWSFTPQAPLEEWQVRRVRRLLNWYWRHRQVIRARSLEKALKVLSRPPHVELVGQKLRSEDGRTFMSMVEEDPSVELSIGLVSEDEKLIRVVNQLNQSMRTLVDALRNKDHKKAKGFFRSLFEHASDSSRGRVLP
jgi:hypothetical protein